MKNTFKLGFIALVAMTIFISSCNKKNAVKFSDDKSVVILDTAKIVVEGSVAYLYMTGGARDDSPEEILKVVNQFSLDYKAKVLNFSPNYSSSNQALAGIWITFEPRQGSTLATSN